MKNFLSSPFPATRWLALAACLLTGTLAAQQATVTGRVIDAESQEPLIGVNILIKNTLSGTISDYDGNYVLDVPSLTDTLVFSYTGYEAQDIPIAGRTQIDVVLRVKQELLQEVVVIGYGVQRKEDVTGAISTLKADEIIRIPNANVEQSLQGKVAGVQVTPVSGRPGEGAAVRIRGVGTFNDASPLYVVDGMLLDDISFLNPNDIQDINVLKDASATAIYGSRGANGVIIITTKRGTSEGRNTFNVDAYYGTQQVVRKIDLANGQEYATLANEVNLNEGRNPAYPNPEVFGEGTDWQDVIFRTAPIQSYQLSANGAFDRINYNLSANYFQQDGIIRGSDFNRLTLRLNAEYKLTEAVTVGHNLAFANSHSTFGPEVLTDAYRVAPIFAPYDSLGNFTNTSPVANAEAEIFYLDNNIRQAQRTVGNLYLDIDFLEHFTLRSSFGLDLENGDSRNFVPEFVVSPIQQNLESFIYRRFDKNRTWLWENTLTYQQTFGNHNLTVLGGITAQDNRYEFLEGGRQNVPDDQEELYYLSAGDVQTQTNNNRASEWAMLSYLFRVNYALLNRYLVTVSFRADGSSRFGSDRRYGYFPSFALGWRITDEPFMEDQRLFSRLKLRGGWGQTGNDKISNYPGRPTVTYNLNTVFGGTETLNTGASIVQLANPEVQWESTTQLNIGLEMGFLNDRLQAEIDFYRRVTEGILLEIAIPSYVGVDAPPFVNAADILNRGFDFKVDWRDRIGPKFSYNLGFVGSTVYNETLALGQGKEVLDGGGIGYNGILGTRTVLGQPVGSYFGYIVEGIFQNQQDLDTYPRRGNEKPGDLRFADINGDSVITDLDRTFIGDAIPNFIYGFSAGFNIAGFDLVVEFNGQSGSQVWNSKKGARFGTYNFEASYLDRWTGEGTSNSEPRVTNGGHNYEPSQRFIESGDFLRLRSVVLGYTLPQSVLDRLHLQRLRLYVSGTNVATWQNYSGYTPEIAGNNGGQDVLSAGIDRGIYPIAKTWTFGLNLSF